MHDKWKPPAWSLTTHTTLWRRLIETTVYYTLQVIFLKTDARFLSYSVNKIQSVVGKRGSLN